MSDRAPLSAVPGLSRTAALPPPPARRPAAASTAIDTPASNVEFKHQPAVEAVRPAAKPAPRRSSAPPKSPPVQTTTLSLPIDLIEALRSRARAERIGQTEVLLDAITAAHDQLGELVQQNDVRPVQDGPFLRTKAPSSHAPSATLTVRLLAANRDAIDELVEKNEARSRSALCAAALRYYLLEDAHARH